MWSLLEIILPVCALVALGFGVRNCRLVKENADDVIGDFVFKIAIPVLLFRLIATSNLEDINPWQIWGTYFPATAAVWITAAFLLPRLFGREALYGVIGGVSSSFANTVLIGIPVIIQAYGEAGMVPVTILLSVHLPVMLLATTFHHEIACKIDGKVSVEGEEFIGKVKRFLLTIIKNPILIGIFSGGLFRLLGFEMPSIMLDITGKVAGIAGPMALIVLGMGLQKYGLKGNLGPALLTSTLKLFIHPALVFIGGAYIFQLPPLFTASLVIASAAPSGVNAYLFAQHFGTGQALSANSISISTPISILTMTLWLAILTVYLGN